MQHTINITIRILLLLLSASLTAQNTNLLSSANGSSIVSYSSTYAGEPLSQDYGIYNLLKSNEERKKEAEFGGFSVWSTETDVPPPHDVVFDLGETKWVTQFNCNTNGYAEHEKAYTGITAKNIEVWQKSEKADDFSILANITLDILSDNQVFNIEPIETRYLKFIVKANHGNESWTYIHFSAADDGRRPYDMASELHDKKMIDLYGIQFDFGKSDLLPESNIIIEEIATVLNENPEISIEIIGHTDNVGSDVANLKLSQERAQSVRQHLVNTNAIDGDRLAAIGMGESEPIDSNDSAEGRAKNRRVTIQLK